MVELKGTSWQQRYSATEIFTLRCKIFDKPGTFAKLSDCIAKTGVNLGEIKTFDLDGQYKTRDITVYLKDKEQLNKLLKDINAIDGIEVLATRNEIFETHRRGSIKVISTASIKSQTDLRMVYTPGVASVCEEVKRSSDAAWEWTGICDRVAIVTNGTAVLGLGDIGPVPSLRSPVRSQPAA